MKMHLPHIGQLQDGLFRFFCNNDNWNRTHRFSGFIWVTGGLLIIINAFIQIPYLLDAIVIGLVLLPFLYSYLFYKSQKTQG